MKLNKVPLIASLLTAGALLMPQKSKALDGIVMNSITNQGIPNAIVKLYDAQELIDSTRTNEEGYYRVSPNSISPEFNLPNNRSNEIKVFDINGRFLYTLNNEWNGRTIPNLPSGTYVFASENKAIAMPVMEGSLLSPIQSSLTKRVLSGKNSSRTSDADELYTLSVSDDGREGEIGDYYDANISFDVARDGINNLEKNVELIPFYDMQDWDGDFLEYLRRVQQGGNTLWGDYPEHYPVNVNLDSTNCARYMGERAEGTLNDIRNALNEWNEMTGLNIFNYEGVNVRGNDAQIRVDYSRDEGLPQFRSHQVRDEDGRYRYDSGVVYLRNDWITPIIIKHEFGHATGHIGESPNRRSIMYGSNLGEATRVTEEDGYIVKTMTTLRNFTPWSIYLRE